MFKKILTILLLLLVAYILITVPAPAEIASGAQFVDWFQGPSIQVASAIFSGAESIMAWLGLGGIAVIAFFIAGLA